MKDFVIRKTKEKGLGVFAVREIQKGEHIFHVDLTGLARYTVQEIDENTQVDGDHSDYIGHGKYVVDDSPASFMNHSCDPNCIVTMERIGVKDVYAQRDIGKDEELTHDYTATSVDQFAGKGFWKDECKCRSAKCRKVLHGDLFKLSKELQKKYYPNLPPSIKRKHRDRFARLRQ
jgi:SET domain-containing protein